ncbi:MAG: family 20 glycosylhydrolase [Kiritimatiellae bacterium]|nr:family 20 glycosylhydrolase [Kiritimatiellia bacterium]
MQRKFIVAFAAFAVCITGMASSSFAKIDADDWKIAAQYQTCRIDNKKYVPFEKVTVSCPDPEAVKWLKAHYKEWYGKTAPTVVAGDIAASGMPVPEGDEAYAASTGANGVKIAANTLAGVRLASYTLRQLTIAKRGTFKTEGWIVPELSITDRPHLSFRAIHLCWFPETRTQQIERAIRLAALLKFNYAIIESWGTFGSEKHPWLSWPNPPMTKKELKRLVAIGRDLGITLIPQINVYGHATFTRNCTRKHVVLDLHPEYEPLFEPGTSNDGWIWCLSNPEAQRVLREVIAEMHESFGNPAYFHLGGDESGAQTCPDCIKTPNDELVLRHFKGLSEFVKSRGARAMMWHDMLISKSNPIRKGYTANGGEFAEKILDALPKDIVICDWQYGKTVSKNWPTMTYFKEKGFSVAGCPWKNIDGMMPMARHLAKIEGFGFIETTWHHMFGNDWLVMYMNGSHAAWGSIVSHGVSFQRSLRLVGHDMKVTDYFDCGNVNTQVPAIKTAY